jgi:hypothetical protein
MRRLLQAALLVLALILVPTSASAAVVQNERVPLDMTIFNQCTGDTIRFTGTIHFLAAATADGNGGFHIHFDDNVSGVTGVGVPSGPTYHGVGGDWFEANVRPPFPVVVTRTDVFGLISTGSAPNLMIKAVFHITINANGTMTSQVDKFSFTCR